jgi:hypothetical protein
VGHEREGHHDGPGIEEDQGTAGHRDVLREWRLDR